MATSAPSPRQQKVIDAYIADPRRNATEAARQAGYKNPRQDGSRIIRQYRQLIDSKVSEMSQVAGMKAQDVLSEIASIAADTTHKDRLRALELLAKIHGLMSDKPVADRKTIAAQIEELLKPVSTAQPESKLKTAKPRIALVRTA